MQWPPDCRKFILEPGNEAAFHSGGRTDLKIDIFWDHHEPEPHAEQQPIAIEEQRLQPWNEWMERVDFERLWDKEN